MRGRAATPEAYSPSLSSVFEQPQTTKKRGGRQHGRALRHLKAPRTRRLLHPRQPAYQPKGLRFRPGESSVAGHRSLRPLLRQWTVPGCSWRGRCARPRSWRSSRRGSFSSCRPPSRSGRLPRDRLKLFEDREARVVQVSYRAALWLMDPRKSGHALHCGWDVAVDSGGHSAEDGRTQQDRLIGCRGRKSHTRCI